MTTKRISAALVAAALMFILIAGLSSRSSVRADGESAFQLEGSWVDEVTNFSGFGAGTTGKNMPTYSRGGGLVMLPAGPLPPGLQSSAGHGTWIHRGGRRFSYTSLFFVYDPAVQFVATVKLHLNLTVNRGGDEYN